ncbi:MAG TPA: amidase [Burkholderiales bacterium]|nr:amidase [Burkholderiales bacterium]
MTQIVDTDPCTLTATELSHAFAERVISPVEVVQAHLARIAEWNDTLRAFVFVDAERALQVARTAEAEIGRHGPRTPLHGIPIGYKDVFDVAGMPTTAGSRLLKGHIAPDDSAVASRVRAAGAIALGKLNTYEFATGGQDLFGEARNPWNLSFAAGGSSTGPAAAVAGRLVTLAMGTDTGGSVRIPASFCGLVALRPTHGLVDRTGIVPLSRTLDEVGPMARSVSDCALLFAALAGVKLAEMAKSLEGTRLGVPSSLWAECEPDVHRCMDEALTTFRQLGATIAEVHLDHARYGLAATWSISYSETFADHRENLATRASDYTSGFFNKVMAAGTLTPEELRVASQLKQIIAGEFAAALNALDAIVLPATPFAAYPLGNQHLQLDNGAFTRPVSCSGYPTLAMPWGFNKAGLPLGMQLVARPREEATLFAIAEAYERATPWHLTQPTFAFPPITASVVPIRNALAEARRQLDGTL